MCQCREFSVSVYVCLSVISLIPLVVWGTQEPGNEAILCNGFTIEVYDFIVIQSNSLRTLPPRAPFNKDNNKLRQFKRSIIDCMARGTIAGCHILRHLVATG